MWQGLNPPPVRHGSYTVVVGEKENPDAAWYYPDPKSAAANIKGYIAFWKGVRIGRG